MEREREDVKERKKKKERKNENEFKDDIRRLDGSKTERQSIQKLEESHLVKDLGLGIKRKNSFILT